MSSSIAIRVENLGKRYRIGHLRKRHDTLRDLIASAFRRGDRRPLVTEDTIWALKDVSFEVNQGEVIGIIGRNGAGKSTLLKILSRITDPTEGFAEIHGRCSSLLEVGTGFHPELTGRENIYLNGSILGMKRAEIAGKFDEIVAFAEVEKFMDTPVKHYSSGMYVRLAFAVAAHLQPEILLVDEVLAVGDIEFQKKCIGKMESVAREGRTVLVVSHSMSTVKALCTKAVLLESGRIKASGAVESVVAGYLDANQTDSAEKQISEKDHIGGVKQLRVHQIKLRNPAGNDFSVFWKQPIQVAIEFEVLERLEQVAFGTGIRAMDGTHVFHVHQDDDRSQSLWSFEPGRYLIEVTLENFLRPGFYKLHFGADIGHLMLKNVFSMDAVTLRILDHSMNGLVPDASNSGLVNGSSAWKPPQRLTAVSV
ncbi:MAG: ABC transporter ATP-binding protein [Verrucomicrobiia bacterium]